MRLKRLDIQGYKSFATKTVFQFDSGVTAIVGPNGSGKSNIMDALRWVMGETANKQMRAKKLEDVIFSGSETRAPAGLAEVKLTLDNSSHWLPIDFNEVAVTRRVHRSGDSEFLINDNRVRLRDIQELFTSSGLGQESYALMGQGLVEEVLRLKPEDRRGMIEEVADVRRHRVKMLDARRKREQAHENLARARLLVEEIEPRLRRLERQAKRALQHAELQAELQAALRRYYRREWRRLRNELAGRQATHDQRRAEQANSRRAVGTADAAMQRWGETMRQAREALEQASSEQRRRAARVLELEHEQEMGGQRQGLLRQRREELRADLQSLDETLNEATRGSGSGASDESAGEGSIEARAAAGAPTSPPFDEAATLAHEVETAREELRDADKALAARGAELDELRRRALEAEQRLADYDRAEQESEQRLLRIGAEREALDQAEEETGARIGTLRQSQEQADRQSAESARLAAQAGAEATQTHAAREDLGRKFYAASAHLRGLEASRSDRERRLTRARDRLQMLGELQAESEGINQGLRALFGSRGVPRDGEETGIPGVIGIVRHLVRAPSGLEHAIEAALEDYVDAVVYETTDEAMQTIRVLLSERAGRIVTLPLDRLKHRSPLAIQEERGVIGIASALVKCESEHRPLIDTLLGRTIVVEDENAARMMAARGLGAAVTRDGNLFRANGAMAGGRASEQGTFSRESELQALPEEIEQLERSLAESANIEGRKADLEAMERELRAAEQASEAAAAVRLQAQDEAGSRRADMTRTLAQLEAAEAELERNQRRSQELAEESSVLAKARDDRSGERGRIDRDRPSSESIAETETARLEAAAVAASATSTMRAAEGEQEALQSAIRAREATIARARAQAAQRQQQLTSLEQELETLTVAIANREQELLEARRASTAVSAEDGEEAKAVAVLQEEEPGLQSALRSRQKLLIEAERSLVQAEGAVHETAAATAHLDEQLVSDELRINARGRISPLGREIMDTASAESASVEGVSAEGESGGASDDEDAIGSETGAVGEVEGGTAVATLATAGLRKEAANPISGDEDTEATRGGSPASGLAAAGHGNGAIGGSEQELDSALEPEQDDELDESEPLAEVREGIDALRGRLRWLGNVNPDAAAEYREIEERHEFLSGQIEDLEGAEQRMLQAEADLGQLVRDRFTTTFEAVDRHFRRYFQTMFRGGTGRLVLTDEDDFEASGVEIVARPPGKRVDNLQMLSGGERSLTAMALLFAMLEVNPAPFSVLDEVDAALDEANVVRFVDGLKELAGDSQFVVITHNRRTIEQADNIYGITMGEDSVSRVLSVRLSDLDLDD